MQRHTIASPARARRRAAALAHPAGSSPASSAGPASRAEAWLAPRVTALALPVDVEAVAPYVPAAVLVLVAVATSLFGVAGAVVLGVATGAVAAVLARSAPRRQAAVAERALPGVLDAVARQLRAGGSLAQAIATARPPASSVGLRQSWDRLIHLVPIVGVSAALDDWATTSADEPSAPSSRSVRLAAAALALAATTGGSPARAIDGVAATLRSRLAVADEVRALSSQARASAAVIAASPVVFAALAGMADARTRGFLASPSGSVLLGLGVGLDLLGAWWMSRLCRPPRAAS